MNEKDRQLPIVFLKHCELPKSKSFSNNTYDILFITTGKCKISYTSTELIYTTGSICMISPYTAYTVNTLESGSMIHMGINPQFINENLPGCDTLTCDSVREPNNNYRIIKELVSVVSSKYLENPEKNRLAIHGFMYRMLSLFEEKYSNSELPADIPPRYKERVQGILRYLNDHYSEPITLEDVAEELFLTPQYLSRFFKNCFHKNFKDYLSDKRLFHAHREICFTDDPITDIAFRCGFSSVNVFSKAFHNRYSISPSRCRKEAKQTANKEKYEELEEISIRKDYSNDYGESRNISYETEEASFYKQHITVQLRDDLPKRKNVCVLINIGHIQNLLMEDFQDDLIMAQKELGIKYIRLEGITESSFIPKVQPDYKYYFNNLDRAMDFLFQNKIIPFIELSKLPFTAKSFSEIKTNYVQRNQQFFDLLEEALSHMGKIYHEKWLALWKFELCYNSSDTIESYTEDFRKIKKLINRYMPGASLGGCGFPAGIEENKLETSFEKLKSRKFSPDFISAHFTLQTKSDNRINIISTKSDYLLTETKKLREQIDRFFGGTPLYITEWTSVFFSTLPIHYSCFQASFICKNVLALQPYCEMLGYWVLSQASSPYMTRYSSPYVWGQGLLDRNHIKMPAYYAFRFLNRLGEYQIDSKENYCITAGAHGRYQILMFNYAHITSENIFLNEEKTSFSDIYKIFETPLPSQIEFNFSDIMPGTYKIEKTLLSLSSGSVLDKWIEGFALGNIDETEYLINIFLPTWENISYYKSSCMPDVGINYIKVKDSLKLNAEIPPHNVCLWNITRLLK